MKRHPLELPPWQTNIPYLIITLLISTVLGTAAWLVHAMPYWSRPGNPYSLPTEAWTTLLAVMAGSVAFATLMITISTLKMRSREHAKAAPAIQKSPLQAVTAPHTPMWSPAEKPRY